MNEDENKRYQTMCNLTNTVLGGKFIELNANTRNKERSQINNLYSLFRKKNEKCKINTKQGKGRK